MKKLKLLGALALTVSIIAGCENSEFGQVAESNVDRVYRNNSSNEKIYSEYSDELIIDVTDLTE